MIHGNSNCRKTRYKIFNVEIFISLSLKVFDHLSLGNKLFHHYLVPLVYLSEL